MLETLFSRISADWRAMPHHEFLGFVRPKCQEALTFERLAELLSTGKRLRVKLGVDATGAELHIGHIVPMLLLKQFQKAGHHVDFIIGDFTATIGDPSGREHARKTLTTSEVKKNAKGFTAQIKPYIDTRKGKVHFNSKWLSKIKMSEMIAKLQHISMSSATQREDFRKRLSAGNPVSLAETLYGFLMGLDSAHLNTDIEIGAIDQLINFQQCRELMESLGMTPETVLCVPLIEGTDGSGAKMSKSVGNTIPLSTSHEDTFGKVMSIPDKLILPWYIAFTDIHESELDTLKKAIEAEPLEMKKQLGILLIALKTKSLKEGQQQRENFERKFAKKELSDEDFAKVDASTAHTLFDALATQFESKSELRRLFEQGAVKDALTDHVLSMDSVIGNNMKVRVGKRGFYKLQK